MKQSTDVYISDMNIVGIGASMLDIIIREGYDQYEYSAGGTCCNVLTGLAALGCNSFLIARFGDDYIGNKLLTEIHGNSIDTTLILQEGHIKTPRIIEKISKNGEYPKHSFLLRCPNCNSYLPRFRSPKLTCVSSITKAHANPDVFFFDKITPSSLKLAEFYYNADSLVFFEPDHPGRKRNIEDASRFSHIVKYSSVYGVDDEFTNQVDKIASRKDNSRKQIIIKTYGNDGLSYKTMNNEWKHKSGINIQGAVDSCGAGDWFSAGLIYKLSLFAKENNIKLKEALIRDDILDGAIDYSIAISALSCLFIGAQGLIHAFNKDDILFLVDQLLNKQENRMSILENYVLKNQKKRHKGELHLSKSDTCPLCLMDIKGT